MTAAVPPGAKGPALDSSALPPHLLASGRKRETFSRASPALTALRVQHVIPETTARAQQRIQELKKLYRTPMPLLKQAHVTGLAQSAQRLRLTKSVRNVKVVSQNGSGSTPSSVVGSLCMPFTTCCALPAFDPAPRASVSSSLVATGAVDGLITVWNVDQCTPLASASSCEGNQWGRVRSLVAARGLPVTSSPSPLSIPAGGAPCLFFSATMFDRRIGVWSLARTADAEEREEERASGNASGGGGGGGGHSAWSLTRLDASPDSASPAAESSHSHIANLNQLAVDPTGNLLASTGDDATLRLWDVRSLTDALVSPVLTGRPSDNEAVVPRHLCTHDGYESVGAVYGVAFHPDGSLVSTTDAGGRVVTWDTRTGRHAFTTVTPATSSPAVQQQQQQKRVSIGGHLSRCTCVAWSPCGTRFASGGADTVIHLWDARMLYKAYTPTVGAAGTLSSVSSSASSPSTSVIAPFQMLGHEDVVTSLSFYTDPFATLDASSNSSRSSGRNQLLPIALVSTSLDGTVRLWDADTGLCVRTLVTGSPVYAHCRPALAVGTAGAEGGGAGAASDGSIANTQAAIFTVGHAKYWAMWDVPSFSDDNGAVGAETGLTAPVMVRETDTLVRTTGEAHGTAHATAEAAQRGGDDDGGSEEEDEEEDEMASLMKSRPEPQQIPPASVAPPPAARASDSASDEDSDDEMALLRKKPKH